MRKTVLIFGVGLALTLSACATPSESSTSPERQLEITEIPEDSSNAEEGTAGDNGSDISPEEQEAADNIATEVVITSCEKAIDEGIIETYTYVEGGPGGTAYLVPEEVAVDNYSAVYVVEGSPVPELIYETLAFSVCTLYEPAVLSSEEGTSKEDLGGLAFAVSDFEEGRFAMPFSEDSEGEQTLVEVIYDPETLVMEDFRLVNAEGIETIVEIDLEYGYNQEGLDYLQQAVEALQS